MQDASELRLSTNKLSLSCRVFAELAAMADELLAALHSLEAVIAFDTATSTSFASTRKRLPRASTSASAELAVSLARETVAVAASIRSSTRAPRAVRFAVTSTRRASRDYARVWGS